MCWRSLFQALARVLFLSDAHASDIKYTASFKFKYKFCARLIGRSVDRCPDDQFYTVITFLELIHFSLKDGILNNSPQNKNNEYKNLKIKM